MTTSYPAALAFLYGLQRHGIKLGLDTIGSLLERTGRPQDRFLSFHIAGTNGKGSTAAIAASVLQAAGYRVGLYTSPHLVDFRERIQVNGVCISEESVLRLTQSLKDACGDCLAPTFFEFTTAMAFHHFADSGVEIAVVEVGMGGRFDATNLLAPLVSVITTISLDHQQYLGETLEEIAFEKAGILKPGIPVVLGRVGPKPFEVIGAVAEQRQARVYRLGTDVSWEYQSSGHFTYHGLAARWGDLFCPLAGEHQLDNAACALAMVEAVRPDGLNVTEQAVRRGLHSVVWGGRLEIAETRPVLLLDGAHNPSGAQVVAQYLTRFRSDHPGCRVVLVIGMMQDKDREGFFKAILPLVDEVVVTEPQLPRAASTRELCLSMGDRAEDVHLVPLPADALARARACATSGDLICVTGSLMLVGEVTALLRGSQLSSIRG